MEPFMAKHFSNKKAFNPLNQLDIAVKLVKYKIGWSVKNSKVKFSSKNHVFHSAAVYCILTPLLLYISYHQIFACMNPNQP